MFFPVALYIDKCPLSKLPRAFVFHFILSHDLTSDFAAVPAGERKVIALKDLAGHVGEVV